MSSIYARGERPRRRCSRTMPRPCVLTPTQASAPEYWSLRTDDRTLSNSLSGFSPRTFRRQRSGWCGSASWCSRSGNESRWARCPAPWRRWLDQIYSHGSATIEARTGLASMYVSTTCGWSLSWIPAGSASALPDVAAGSLSPVVPPGVSECQRPEDADDRLPGGRLEKQMKMVGHRAVAEVREGVHCLGAGEIG